MREGIRRIYSGKVQYAEKKGILIKKGVCRKCGTKGRTEWHHPDYSSPLYVEEWCTKCHRGYHNRKRKGMKYNKPSSQLAYISPPGR